MKKYEIAFFHGFGRNQTKFRKGFIHAEIGIIPYIGIECMFFENPVAISLRLNVEWLLWNSYISVELRKNII